MTDTAEEVRQLRVTVERFDLAVGRLLVVLERQLASNDHAMKRAARFVGEHPLNEALQAQLRAKLAGKGR